MNTATNDVHGLATALRGNRVLLAGGIAATADLVFAIGFYGMHGVSPQRVAQSIASGVLGRSAFQDGIAAVALGLFCHYFILLIAAAFYAIACTYLQVLDKHRIAFGLLYGFTIFIVMRGIIVPLSAAPTFNTSTGTLAAELGSHLFLVGLPIGLLARQTRPKREY